MTVAPDVTPPATSPTTYVAGELVGGPLGRHARRGARWTLLSALVLTTIITCLVGYGQKLPCRDVANWQHNYQYTRVCYSDILPLYSTEKLNEGKVPYVDQPVEYPVLIGAAMEAGALVAKAAPKDDFTARNALFFDATAILLTIAAVITVICTALTAGTRRMDVMLLAAAPLLAFHAFTNWDLLAVAFAAGGMLAWSKRAPAVAGILFGFGAATKAYPLLILVAIGLLAYRAGPLGAWRPLHRLGHRDTRSDLRRRLAVRRKLCRRRGHSTTTSGDSSSSTAVAPPTGTRWPTSSSTLGAPRARPGRRADGPRRARGRRRDRPGGAGPGEPP